MRCSEGGFEFENIFDHSQLCRAVSELGERYPFLDIGSIGRSILGRDIPRISIGSGAKSVLYIGAHHGMEWLTSAILTQFLFDFCRHYELGAAPYGVSCRILFETRRIDVIPMLDPDGIDYSIHGAGSGNILAERLARMEPSGDLSHWQANARGVDLNHNYRAGFEEYKRIERELGILGGAPTRYSGEYPESEPEVRALCALVRAIRHKLALTLHTQGEEIYYTSLGSSPSAATEQLARTLSRLSGYALSSPEEPAAFGGFTDWFIDEIGEPSFTVECGRGENPLPFSELPSIYSRIKKMLFTAPILI